MTRAEAETAIRELSQKWAAGRGIELPSETLVSFSEFTSWLSVNGYSRYLRFRSTAGAEYDAELWFDDEMKQTWRR